MPRSREIPPVALLLLGIVLVAAVPASGQVIEFWSNGLKYQALTRGGLTIMYARMPLAVRRFGVIQVAASNGSGNVWKLKPQDFVFEPEGGGTAIRASSENEVIYDLFRNAGYSEVIKLQSTYEQALYGNQHIRSNNGYEQRRLSALALGPKGLKAAAAASAIAFVTEELSSGDSTDGAMFFVNGGKPLGEGRIVAVVEGQVFEFRSN